LLGLCVSLPKRGFPWCAWTRAPRRMRSRAGGGNRTRRGAMRWERWCGLGGNKDRRGPWRGAVGSVRSDYAYLGRSQRAVIMVGRYTHAHQFKRARRELKFLRTRLGRIIRDIRRKIEGNTALEDRFGPLLGLALRVRHGRNYLAHASGNAINAVLTAAGYNFRRLLAWLRFFLLRILIALGLAAQFKSG